MQDYDLTLAIDGQNGIIELRATPETAVAMAAAEIAAIEADGTVIDSWELLEAGWNDSMRAKYYTVWA